MAGMLHLLPPSYRGMWNESVELGNPPYPEIQHQIIHIFYGHKRSISFHWEKKDNGRKDNLIGLNRCQNRQASL